MQSLISQILLWQVMNMFDRCNCSSFSIALPCTTIMVSVTDRCLCGLIQVLSPSPSTSARDSKGDIFQKQYCILAMQALFLSYVLMSVLLYKRDRAYDVICFHHSSRYAFNGSSIFPFLLSISNLRLRTMNT